jgi:hypothetical protein
LNEPKSEFGTDTVQTVPLTDVHPVTRSEPLMTTRSPVAAWYVIRR